jgi:hypothetical protein
MDYHISVNRYLQITSYTALSAAYAKRKGDIVSKENVNYSLQNPRGMGGER